MRVALFIAILVLILSSCANDPNKGIENNTGDNITALNAVGTPHQTSVRLTWDTATFDLNSIDAYIMGEELEISFSDTAYKVNGLAIDLQKNTQNPLVTVVRQTTYPTDCLYVVQSFKVLQQATQLNNDQYHKGDLIYGSIDLLLLGKKDMFREALVPFIDKRKWDTVRLNGSFIGQVN
jgi:hypothetical protein